MLIALEFTLGVFLVAIKLPLLMWVACGVDHGIEVYHRWLFAVGVTMIAHAYFIGRL